MVDIIISRRKPFESEVYSTYWKFAQERQNIFFNRINNELRWTNDEILIKHKFTNAYRASDRVSQYLIKNVIYKGDQNPKEVLFRILLFKTFNKIETWQYLLKHLKEISFKNFNFKTYNNILSNLKNQGESIYSGAYIMTSGKSSFGYTKKHQNHLTLIDYMMKDQLHDKIIEAKSLEEVFIILKSYPTLGNFLAYQYTVDINYSNIIDFSEMDFVMPGPGALDGIKKCFIDFGDYNETDIIKYVTNRQDIEFEKNGIDFRDLWGRKLQLIDCQNLFCEVDKYARIAHPNVKGISGRTRIKQKFKPTNKEIKYWYPPKWGINEKISESWQNQKENIFS